MKFHYDLSGAQQNYVPTPVYGNAANIKEGAAVARGATPGTNQGFAILAPTGLAAVLGICGQPHTNTVAGADSKQDGTAYTFRKVLVNPFAVFLVENAAGAVAITSVSTTTVNITSLEDNIDGGWMLGSDGQLQYITAGDTTGVVTVTNSGWTSATTLTKILPLFHNIGTLNSTSDKILNATAAGSGKIRVIKNYIKAVGLPLTELDPTKHSGLTLTSPVVYTDILFTDHAFGING